jgi:TolA-binding protein
VQKGKIMKKITTALIITAATACIVHADTKLEKRVAELEKEVAELKTALAPVMEKAKTEQIVAQERGKAKSRMRKDSEIYSRDELREIEKLYQVANKQWRSQAGKDSLKELIKKYDKANRTGCALLYLGQMSKGKEQEEYLKQAIDDFSDCFYGDGVQVGAYARYYLAYHYKNDGDESKAKKLFAELEKEYPNAINHKGKLLSNLIEK